MLIFINDTPREYPEGSEVSLAELLAEAGLPSLDGVAAAVNDSVVPKARWAAQRLSAGDRVLVIRATQGG